MAPQEKLNAYTVVEGYESKAQQGQQWWQCCDCSAPFLYSSLRNRVSCPSVFHKLQKAWIMGWVYASHVLVSVEDRHSRVPSDSNGLASQRTSGISDPIYSGTQHQVPPIPVAQKFLDPMLTNLPLDHAASSKKRETNLFRKRRQQTLGK